jgi:uncharacterized membrane protein
MILENFQRKLRQEAKLWRDEGLISSSQHDQLAERYQFNKLDAVARERFVLAAIGIGGLLLVFGVMIFVGANWQIWSREARFILLISLFLATSFTGFYTWRQPAIAAAKEGKKLNRDKRLLGEALLFLSALILGANIALMGQIFNINGSTAELFFAWGFGVLVMAYALSLNSLGVLAIILIQIGYWIGLRDFWSSPGELSWARLAVRHMPILSWLLFVPLAYICRSRWIFGMGIVAFTISLQYNLNPLPLLTLSDVVPWVASFALVLPPALFWSYDDLLFPTINYRLFQPLARNLGLLCFGIVFYLLSFRWQWQSFDDAFSQPNNFSSVFRSLPIIDLGILSGLAVLQWLFMLRQRNNPMRREVFFKTLIISIFLGCILVIPFWHQAIARVTEFGVIVFNVLLVTLAWGLIQEGLKLRDRRPFWCGMLLLTLQVISRVLEYDTDLLFKSLVFVTCGYCLITAGLWFEKRLSSSSSSGNKK